MFPYQTRANLQEPLSLGLDVSACKDGRIFITLSLEQAQTAMSPYSLLTYRAHGVEQEISFHCFRPIDSGAACLQYNRGYTD